MEGMGICKIEDGTGNFSQESVWPVELKQNISNSYKYNFQLDINNSSIAEKGCLGLTLTKTPDFCNLVNVILARAVPEKFKASNFSISCLQIGNWKKVAYNEGSLVGRFHYSSKKIAWEILIENQRHKMEIKFTEIEAIKAIIRDNEPGILKIQLKLPPDFAVEAASELLKQTKWEKIAYDFTQDQALVCRTHTVTCLPGVLDKHYNQLLRSSSRLLALSQKPFSAEVYFQTNAVSANNISSQNNFRESQVDPLVQHCYGPFQEQSGFLLDSNPPMPATGLLPDDNGKMVWKYNQENTIDASLQDLTIQDYQVPPIPGLLPDDDDIMIWNHNQENTIDASFQDITIQDYQVPGYVYGSESGINNPIMEQLFPENPMPPLLDHSSGCTSNGGLGLDPTQAQFINHLPAQICHGDLSAIFLRKNHQPRVIYHAHVD